MAKKECKKCKKFKDECECPTPLRKGWYGLHPDDDKEGEGTDTDIGAIAGAGGGEGGLGEAVRMPRAPQDSDKDMQGISSDKKRKKLADFTAASKEAKKRQSDENRKAELADIRRKRGIKFYDAKGSGYIKGGKKHYD